MIVTREIGMEVIRLDGGMGYRGKCGKVVEIDEAAKRARVLWNDEVRFAGTQYECVHKGVRTWVKFASLAPKGTVLAPVAERKPRRSKWARVTPVNPAMQKARDAWAKAEKRAKEAAEQEAFNAMMLAAGHKPGDLAERFGI